MTPPNGSPLTTRPCGTSPGWALGSPAVPALYMSEQSSIS